MYKLLGPGRLLLASTLRTNGIQVREREELDTGVLWFDGDRWRIVSGLHLTPVAILCTRNGVFGGRGAWWRKEGIEEGEAKVVSEEVWTLGVVENGWYEMDGGGGCSFCGGRWRGGC